MINNHFKQTNRYDETPEENPSETCILATTTNYNPTVFGDALWLKWFHYTVLENAEKKRATKRNL